MIETDEARRTYADWYVREELARRAVKTMYEATYVVNSLISMGIEPPVSSDVISYCRSVAYWLLAEADHQLLNAAAVLRSRGAAGSLR